ncbi:aromatic ring-hydroxylating oxygenase subunit alpha [Ottowia thiooxydans]|uniref:aromatic ring-hydroxylating oxygenase subunit alpha n=1 Tax=Ottowia thiooxydans TaxID=219182 RepID=UPI0004043089|nr:aromatic ring-hydroxylating dioxygenase subunit alpha [Ottowia thiooxydans]
MSDIFAPEAFAAARKQLPDASTLPPAAYHDAAFYQREIDRLFLKEWNFIGHEDQLPSPRSYFTIDFAGVPVIVARNSAGEIHAFANSCRHRGARLVSGEGTSPVFVCKYHSWSYDLNGSLRGCPGMEDVKNFNKEENGLVPVRLEKMGPFMWINFDEKAVSLAEHLGDLPTKVGSHGIDELVLTRRMEHDVKCNWKVFVENFMDYYHTPTVHKKTLARGSLSVYHRKPVELAACDGNYLELYAAHEGTAGLLPGVEGFPVWPGLEGRNKEGSTFIFTSSCGLFGFTKDCVWYVQINPTGPESIRLTLGSCFHRSTVARPDFEEIVQRYYERWDVAVAEDNEINELQQQGVRSPLCKPGRVSPLEAVSYAFRRQLLDKLGL